MYNLIESSDVVSYNGY